MITGIMAVGAVFGVFAVVMCVVGGFFPARRASKLPVIQELR